MNILVFHGSKTPIQAFDSSKHLSGYYPGFYTTSDRELARWHGNNLYQMQIDSSKFYQLVPRTANNLKVMAKQAGFYVNNGSGSGEAKYLASQGYHGIRRGTEFIIFQPEQTTVDFGSFREWLVAVE